MKRIFLATFFVSTILTKYAFACAACSIGALNVGTNLLLPNNESTLIFVDYNHINQNQNISKDKKVADENQEHQGVKSQVINFGAQKMFNKKHGFNIRVPYIIRDVDFLVANYEEGHEEEEEEEHHSHSGSSASDSGFGDVRISGIYSGFFDDMSLGITYGVKLPTGETKHQNLSRAEQLGSGTIDSLLGMYYTTTIFGLDDLGWFSQISWQNPLTEKRNYRPGDEYSASTGVYYNLGKIMGGVSIVPNVQLIGFKKDRDNGAEADVENSGFKRLSVSVGPEFRFKHFSLYTDVQMPIYQSANGVQIVSREIFRAILSYNF